MRKTILLCAGILMLSLTASAQDPPKFDVFGGYSYVRLRIGSPGGTITSNLNGGNGAVAFYPGKWFGLVGDFGGYKLSNIKVGGNSLDVDGSIVTYLFGPRFRFESKGVTPFAQILFGGGHHGDITTGDARSCAPATAPCTVQGPENFFAMTTEGGIDLKLARHFAIRGQAGYLMTRLKEDTVSGTQQKATQNNARISVGIVIR